MSDNTASYHLDSLASLEAEYAILGSLILDNASIDRMGDTLKPEHFFSEINRRIFVEVSKQLNAGKGCDVITLYEALQDHDVSIQTLNDIAQYVQSSANLRRHVGLVVERAKSRQLLAVSSEIVELAQDHHTPIADRVEAAQGALVKLLDDAPRDEWIDAYEGMALHTQVLEDRANGKIIAWSTGIPALDDYLEGGLRPAELVIIGARPSMGKTAIAMTIGLNMASDYSVGFLSMEMSHNEVRDRMTAMLGNVSLSSVKRPNKGQGLQWDSVVDGTNKAKTLNFYVSDQGGLNINQVRSKARNLKRMNGLNVLIVDYIGLMTGLDQKQNRNTQLEEVSRGLKNLAKELDISIVCLAQLNRKSEERPEQMPMMSDLRDCGAIEQDADVIVFIKRPIMANPELGEAWQHYAKLSVAKNRQGRCGYLNLTYTGEQTRFSAWHGEAPSKAFVPQKRGMA